MHAMRLSLGNNIGEKMKILNQQEEQTTQEQVYDFVISKFHEMGWLDKDICREIMLADYDVLRKRYKENGITVSRSMCDRIAMESPDIQNSTREKTILFEMFVGLSKIILAKSNED